MQEPRRTDLRLTRLVQDLKAADDERHRHMPSTSAYHDAADRIEDLAHEVYRTAIEDELDAEEHAELEQQERAS